MIPTIKKLPKPMGLKGSFRKKNTVKTFNNIATDNRPAELDSAESLFVLEIIK
jgi:hypothetical protein